MRYKWEVYCDTFLSSSGGWGFRHSSEKFRNKSGMRLCFASVQRWAIQGLSSLKESLKSDKEVVAPRSCLRRLSARTRNHKRGMHDLGGFLASSLRSCCQKTGPYPQYGLDFPEGTPKNSGKTPLNALRAFPGIPLECTAGIPQAL